MEVGPLLVRLLIVVVAARAAAELAERFGQPAVLAEIAAGVLIGPSVLGLVHTDEVLRALGELGAILLLFEVGMQMKLTDLRRAGRASLRVATIGVVAPMALGFVAMRALGLPTPAALFLAAGLTATSVGITARVFSDLRALASTEARTILGAAVADDVIGLLILAVVVRVGTGQALGVGSLVALPLIAIGFVAGAAAAGAIVAPRLFGMLTARARTDGALTAFGFAFALGTGVLATLVKLAPIVGAFVAGVAVAETPVRDEIHRRLTSVGHLVIPIFFVQIGIETDVRVFGDPWVLGIGGVLCVIAVAGKICAGLGVARGTADRLLVGVGMIPRGEVGLIFASLGLARGVLDARTHAVLLLMVFVTTVATPPWIRRRITATRKRSISRASVLEPPGGWLHITDEAVELAAEPPAGLTAPIGLDAALACTARTPGARLLAWLASAPEEPAVWDDGLRRRFLTLLRDGDVRQWRFLDVSGVLARLLPRLDAALRARMRDPFDLDPAGALRWDTLDDLKASVSREGEPARIWSTLERRDVVLIAALARSAFRTPDAAIEARALGERIGLPEDDLDLLAFLVGERGLLPAAAARLDAGLEDAVLELAAHVHTTARADALYLLAAAESPGEALRELWQAVREALAHPELTGQAAIDLVERHRRQALEALAGFPVAEVRRHLDEAPHRYLLAQPAAAIAQHLRMIETRPHGDEIRLYAEPNGAPGVWKLHVALLDRRGALAALAGAFAACGLSVHDAFVSTWRTGIAIDVFRIAAPEDIDWSEVAREAGRALHEQRAMDPAPIEGSIEIDNLSSPWHSVVSVRAHDRTGLLFRVASAIARAGGQIHHATIATMDDLAVDQFLVTGPDGHKLDAGGEARLRLAFAGGTPRRLWSRRREPARASR